MAKGYVAWRNVQITVSADFTHPFCMFSSNPQFSFWESRAIETEVYSMWERGGKKHAQCTRKLVEADCKKNIL